jgi:hypothetical protein
MTNWKDLVGIGRAVNEVIRRAFEEGHKRPQFGPMLSRFELDTSQLEVKNGYDLWQFAPSCPWRNGFVGHKILI